MTETSDVSKRHFYVYILHSLKDKGLYIGFTSNLKTRIKTHIQGNVPATHARLPVKLIHYEYFINEDDAKAREEFLKSGYGRRQLKSILSRTLGALPQQTPYLVL
ncbi:MAG: GIY-YIG nuclease family protein [Candidatus Levybacteria bacterium]|nr:GIY-YIG nuclease family protein [Candidatus Levybacteria bacterium]